MSTGASVVGAGKTYEGKVALEDVSFSIPDGSVTGVIGPNGCGKSTLFRLMSNLASGDGHVTYNGRKLSDYDNPGDIVGLSQGPIGLPPRRTLAQHLRLLGRLSGSGPERVDEVIAAVGLSTVADEYPVNYSYGMMQRASLAGALLNNPQTLLLDEPMNGLDPSGIVAMLEFIRAYADRGRSVLISSHVLTGLGDICDQILVLSRGRLLACGHPTDLIAQHGSASVFVRTEDNSAFCQRLTAEGLSWRAVRGGMEVSGGTMRRVGELARDASIAVFELSESGASLDTVYMRLLKNSEDYSLALV